VSDGCRDKKDNGFKRIQAVRTPTDYNLHPIVINSKAHKDGPFMEKGRRQPPKSLVFYDPLKWEKAILNPS
jgi:hypothetical protein